MSRSRKKVGTLIPLPQLQAGDYLIEQREWSSVLLYHFGGARRPDGSVDFGTRYQRQVRPKQGRKWLVLEKVGRAGGGGFTRVLSSFEGDGNPVEGWLENRTMIPDYWKAVRL